VLSLQLFQARPRPSFRRDGLLGEPIFDHCDKRRHYAVGAAANGAHVAWDAFTPYHEVGECPNASETIDGAWEQCTPPITDDF
jgi:hypothetical protein